MKKIGLLWHSYPSQNLGVGALSYSHLKLLDQAAADLGLAVEYFVAGMMPEAENRLQDATRASVTYRQFSLKRCLSSPRYLRQTSKQFGECAVFFDLSEGDSFADIYGGRRFFVQSLSKSLALWNRVPLVLSPQTIGPFDRWYGKWIAKQILKRSRKVFARDDLSFNYVGKLIGDENVAETIDVAFALPFDRSMATGIDWNCINVGINVSGLLYHGGYSSNNAFRLTLDYPQFIDRCLEHFTNLEGVRVHLVAHVLSDRNVVEDDYRVCEDLRRRYPSCVMAPRFTSPLEAKSYIANMDFFSGARMHATIAAFSAGVPVVPCAYSRKFAGLFGSLGYTHLIEGQRDSTDEAMRRIATAFERRDELRTEVARGNTQAQERLDRYRSFLRSVLSEVARG